MCIRDRSGIMVGRGIIADPALFREARGGAPAAREELRGYLDDRYLSTPLFLPAFSGRFASCRAA